MRKIIQLFTVLATIFVLAACGTDAPPLDSNGKTPQQVLMDTYVLIVEGNFEAAEKNFSSQFLQEFVSSKQQTFAEYCRDTSGWKKEWLKTILVGNDYNDQVWRVKIIPDEGKGKEKGPGIVQDLHIIDGVWKVVFWGHYPKS